MLIVKVPLPIKLIFHFKLIDELKHNVKKTTLAKVFIKLLYKSL